MSLTSKEAFARLPQRLYNFFIAHPPRPFVQYADKPTAVGDPARNPFLPSKNPESGRWHGAKYSGRRSADLYKMAYKFGIADLLPPTPHKKFYQDKYDNKNWMRGQLKQKHHKWERNLQQKVQERAEAISKMDQTILESRPSYKKQLQKREKRKRTWW